MHVKCLRMAMNCPSSVCALNGVRISFFRHSPIENGRKALCCRFGFAHTLTSFKWDMAAISMAHSYLSEICVLPVRIKNTDTHTIAAPFNESTLLYNVSHSILKNKVLHLTVCQARFVHSMNTLPHPLVRSLPLDLPSWIYWTFSVFVINHIKSEHNIIRLKQKAGKVVVSTK